MPRCEYCKKVKQKGVKQSFHQFPHDERLRKMWLENMGRPNWEPPQYAALCSDHFENYLIDFQNCKWRLRKGSIPTKFENEPVTEGPKLTNLVQLRQNPCPPMNPKSSSTVESSINVDTHQTELQLPQMTDHTYCKLPNWTDKQLEDALHTVRLLTNKVKALKQQRTRAEKRNTILKDVVRDLEKDFVGIFQTFMLQVN